MNSKASNLAHRAELGRLPPIVFYLNNKDNDSIVKQSFLMLKHLHSVNYSGFYSNFLNMVEQNNLSTLDPGRLGTDIIRRYTKNMKRNIIYVSGNTALSIHRN